jgi:hypothetical protein
MEMFTRTNISVFFVDDPHETKPLVACNEFPNGCNPQKAQVLDVGVILTQI